MEPAEGRLLGLETLCQACHSSIAAAGFWWDNESITHGPARGWLRPSSWPVYPLSSLSIDWCSCGRNKAPVRPELHYTLGMASQEAGSRQDQQHEVLSQACPSAVAAARGIGLHGANYNIRHGLAWTGSKACSWARDLVPGLSIGRAGISGKQVHAWPVARRCHQPGPWHQLNNSSQYGRSWFL